MIKLYWHWKYWDWYINDTRFNSGYPYTSYRFGPLEIRKYWS